MDFSDIQHFQPGTHAGVLVMRLRNAGRLALATRIRQVFQTEMVGEWEKCFIVVSERKIRIRRPKPDQE